MDSEFKLIVPQAPHDSMDFLSRDWCKSTVQIFQPVTMDDQSIVRQEHAITSSSNDFKASPQKMERSNTSMDDTNPKSIPPWKNNDVKSWIWMQQAMHPEVNYDPCFIKKWKFPWKMTMFKNVSIKKWMKEIKQKRKEEDRLQKAEVHAAISVAGVAAALAAVAAENTKSNEPSTEKEAAVASAAALVAAQCAQVAEAMGAKREQLSTVMGSAMFTSSPTDILTLTAAAATSLRGAATLRARPGGRRDIFNGSSPVIPIEDEDDLDIDFDKCRTTLSKGVGLNVQTSDGKCIYRSVSIILNRDAKVVLKIRKINILSAFTTTKQSVVLDLHAELYKDSYSEAETSYYIVLTTSRGIIKLDMKDDYDRYRTWAKTINHMLMLSTSFTGYELQFYKN